MGLPYGSLEHKINSCGRPVNETTEVAEKHSVSSKRVDKKQRHRAAEKRLAGRG
jgi:hypothetical protein